MGLEMGMARRGVSRGGRAKWIAALSLAIGLAIPCAFLWMHLNQARVQQAREHLFWTLCQPGHDAQQRTVAFLILLEQGNREWRSADLERLDFSGLNLSRAGISNARMEGCKLVGADLSDAGLAKTQLDQADLTAANLTRADLFEADLIKARLCKAVFDMANMRGASIEQCDATGASFVATDLSGARMELAILKQADLRSARLTEADLRLADLSGANLAKADLTGASLRGVELANTNWWRATGLNNDQIKQYILLFPPHQEADAAMKADFAAFLKDLDSVDSG